MFSGLFKEKQLLEERVRVLQNQYIAFKQQQIIGNNTTDEQKENLHKILDYKIKEIARIKEEYNEAVSVSKEIYTLLKDTKEAAESTGKIIDLLAQSLNIEYPEELTIRAQTNKRTVPLIQIEQVKRLSDQNSSSSEVDDKENSKDQSDYFSPNIQIRKSLVTDENIFTPAIKSQKKPKNPFLN